MDEKKRMKVARILDKLPFACWADLVAWAIYGKNVTKLSEAMTNGRKCAKLSQDCPACYCGKFCIYDEADPENGEW